MEGGIVRTEEILPRRGSFGGVDAGGVLALSDALRRWPEAGLVLYHRMSGYKQAGKGLWKLQAATTDLFDAVRARASWKVLHIPFSGVEEGKLSKRRPKLIQAAGWAVRYAATRHLTVILVASDLSRFIRAESYCRRTHPEARPTPEEFAQLHEMTRDIPLATLADPLLTEKERHARTMDRARRAGTCGRPRKPLEPTVALQILEMLGRPRNRNGRVEWDTPMGVVAERFRIPKARVQRLLDEPAPNRPGRRWKDLPHPAAVYREALRLAGYVYTPGRVWLLVSNGT
jgi:hypothetical protein